MGSNVLLLIWSSKSDPFLTRFNNRLETNTEMFLAIITYHLICFTDFIPEKGDGLNTRVLMGFSFISWVCLLVAINLTFVFAELLRVFRLNMYKKYKIFLKKHYPAKLKVLLEKEHEERMKSNKSIAF